MSVISAGSRPAAAHAAAIRLPDGREVARQLAARRDGSRSLEEVGDVQVVFLFEDHGAAAARRSRRRPCPACPRARSPSSPARRRPARRHRRGPGRSRRSRAWPVLVVIVGHERDRRRHVAGGAVGRGLSGHLRDRVRGAGLTRVARLAALAGAWRAAAGASPAPAAYPEPLGRAAGAEAATARTTCRTARGGSRRRAPAPAAARRRAGGSAACRARRRGRRSPPRRPRRARRPQAAGRAGAAVRGGRRSRAPAPLRRAGAVAAARRGGCDGRGRPPAAGTAVTAAGRPGRAARRTRPRSPSPAPRRRARRRSPRRR